MFPPKSHARLLQQIAQSSCGYAVVQLVADCQIGSKLAFVLAEPARQAHCRVQSVALYMLMEHREILRVSSRETGTPEANHNFDGSIL
jgi:hypothetical protein